MNGFEGGRASYITGDVRDVLATIPDGSVDLVLTSPPFLALRSYLPADHPDKHREIGSEPDPAGFLSTLLGLTAEWRRVLAPHGSICVELGDTYSGSGGAGGDWSDSDATTRPRVSGGGDGGPPRRVVTNGWPEAKSLCGIPHLYHLSLAYGRNLLLEPYSAVEALQWVDDLRRTGMSAERALAMVGGWVATHGEPQRFPRWRVRNVVAWCRPNPPVGRLGDKFRPATSYMTVATVAQDRYFDLDAVRTEPKDYGPRYGEHKVDGIPGRSGQVANPVGADGLRIQSNPGGAPPLDWWEIPTQPYSGSHYAVWPPALLDRPIRSMVPRKVCTVCGKPSRRIITGTEYVDANGNPHEPQQWGSGIASGKAAHSLKPDGGITAVRLEGGFTDCEHDAWRPGIVLDPFAGSGTTLMVATGHGHHAIGIDLDPRNPDLACERVGPMFLDHFTLDDWKNR